MPIDRHLRPRHASSLHYFTIDFERAKHTRHFPLPASVTPAHGDKDARRHLLMLAGSWD